MAPVGAATVHETPPPAPSPLVPGRRVRETRSPSTSAIVYGAVGISPSVRRNASSRCSAKLRSGRRSRCMAVTARSSKPSTIESGARGEFLSMGLDLDDCSGCPVRGNSMANGSGVGLAVSERDASERESRSDAASTSSMTPSRASSRCRRSRGLSWTADDFSNESEADVPVRAGSVTPTTAPVSGRPWPIMRAGGRRLALEVSPKAADSRRVASSSLARVAASVIGGVPMR